MNVSPSTDASLPEVSTVYLGFTRDDILSLPHSELLARIQQEHPMHSSLLREEYVDNEEHLRRNMTILLEKITKEQQKAKKLLEEVIVKDTNTLMSANH